jgi:hypothetical protein
MANMLYNLLSLNALQGVKKVLSEKTLNQSKIEVPNIFILCFFNASCWLQRAAATAISAYVPKIKQCEQNNNESDSVAIIIK